MKDIRSQYGDAVIVEFSGDGMAALVEGIKGSMVPEKRPFDGGCLRKTVGGVCGEKCERPGVGYNLCGHKDGKHSCFL